ncbi:MAG: SpoIIE family protein phosphatase [Deltaproteobacteria bacterium]|nr:SpoIIE family protein phosphatase [Deltaproteobacteria bacterium]
MSPLYVGPKVPSPVRGQATPLAVTQGAKQADEIQAEQKLQQVDLRDVDRFLAERAQKSQRSGLLPSLLSLLGAKPKGPPQPDARALQGKLADAVATLTRVYADGLVTEAEIGALQHAKARLTSVLELQDPAVLHMLPRDVRERLQVSLFEPAQVLLDAATRRSGRVLQQVAARDEAALQERLAKPEPSYQPFAPSSVAQGGPGPSSLDRYAPGDLVAVPRSDGSLSLGVVTGRDPDGLRVEVTDAHGRLALKKLDAGTLAKVNPFKIGDVLDFDGGRAWVTGVGNNGKLAVTVQDARGVRHVGGNVPPGHAEHGWLEGLQQGFLGSVQALKQPPAPPVKDAVVSVVGGAETRQPHVVVGKGAEGALFSYRGIGYKNYNEDAAVVGTARGQGGREIVYAGAFDQAGGMGGVPGQTGAASKAAADRFQQAVAQIASGADAGVALQEAGKAAHADVVGFGVGAATTFAAGVIVDGQAIVANCGDSGVLLVDKHGRIKAMTEAHNLGEQLAKQTGDPNAGLNVSNVVTSALGSKSAPKVDVYRWPVAKGDRLVFLSDGVLDANLEAQRAAFAAGKPWKESAGDVTAREVARIVSSSANSAIASQGLVDYARSQVENGRGKPDNVTAVVVSVA